MQKKSRGGEAKRNIARISNALASFAGSPPVPRLSTGIFQFSSLFAIAHRSSNPIGRECAEDARRYDRPSGLLT
jgi:hypothetical protein